MEKLETMWDMTQEEADEMGRFIRDYIQSGKMFDHDDEEENSEFKELTGMSEKEYYLG